MNYIIATLHFITSVGVKFFIGMLSALSTNFAILWGPACRFWYAKQSTKINQLSYLGHHFLRAFCDAENLQPT